MYTILFCDDNPIILDYYTSLTKEIADRRNLEVRVNAYSSAESLLFHVSEYPGYVDILYMDIKLSKQNGLSAAKRLRRLGCHAEIIFLTSFTEYALEAFDVQPFHYLLKDVIYPNEFENVFNRAIANCSCHSSDNYILQTPFYTARLEVQRISYLEVYGKTVTIHYESRDYQFRSAFSSICKEFEPLGFIKISQCYCINSTFVCHVDPNSIFLITGQQLPISRRYKKQVKQALNKLILGH